MFYGSESPALQGGDTRAVDSLTRQDREQMATLYSWASENGVDLAHVDALTSDLAMFRARGSVTTPYERFDLSGHQVFYEFGAKDSALAEQILKSDELQNTQLDQNFIRTLMNPNASPSHVSNFEFVQKALSIMSGTSVATTNHPTPSGQEQKLGAWVPSGGVSERCSPEPVIDVQSGQYLATPRSLDTATSPFSNLGGGHLPSQHLAIAEPKQGQLHLDLYHAVLAMSHHRTGLSGA